MELSPSPALPQLPANRFPREEIVNEILDLTDQVASTALFGSIGIGKSSVALTLLHHNRSKVRFGRNRHFMRCDDLANSLEAFLERLSDAIGTSRNTDIDQLRSHLESSPPLILVLDGVDSLLDPPTPEAQGISAAIEELGCCQNVCLVTTSRMYPEIQGFHRIEVPAPSGRGGRDALYGLCNLGRSSVVDAIIAESAFHPPLIDLIATAVRENNWDESELLKAWNSDQTNSLKKAYHRNLEDAMKLSFRSPTVQNLGTVARDTLKAIAAYPEGVVEGKLEMIFPGIAGVGEVVAILCKFSLLYRQGGFVKMLSPFRSYFLDSMLEPAQHAGTIHWDDDCNPAPACMSFSLRLFVAAR